MTTENNNIALQNNDDSSLKLTDIWNMFWDYIWWYVVSVAICIAFAVIYLYKTQDTYVRAAKVIVSDANQNSAMNGLFEMTGGSMLNSGISVNNEVEALASHDLMEQVVKRLGLETEYVEKQFFRNIELYKNSPVEMKYLDGVPSLPFSFVATPTGGNGVELRKFKAGLVKFDDEIVSGSIGDTLVTPVGRIMLVGITGSGEEWKNDILIKWNNSKMTALSYSNALTVSVPNKSSSVVEISMKGGFPSKLESIINTLIDVYNERWVLDKNKSARNTSDFINERLIVIEQELGGIETSLKNYKEKNNLTDIKAVSQQYLEESSEYATKSFEINNQLSIAKYIREYIADPANSQSLIPANSGLDFVSINSQIGEYNTMILKRDNLLSNSSERNPIIAEMNKSLTDIRNSILRSVDNAISTLELQVSKIEEQEKMIIARIASTSGQELQLLTIERQQKVKESLYIYLLQKREENEIASLVNVDNTRLIVSPSGPLNPVSPNKLYIVLFAIIAGIGIPFGAIFLKRMLDTTIKTKDDLSAMSVPFLAEIPQIMNNEKRAITILDKRKFNTHNCRVVVEGGKRDTINEAFRVLRTNLDLIMGRDASHQVIMLTSFNPNSGKTFISMNLAASMALKGEDILLMDLDLRKSTTSKVFGDNRQGISQYLNEHTDNYSQFIHEVAPHFHLMTVGPIPPNPAELLLSERFRTLISSLKEKYSCILVDCPPIDVVADTAIISEFVDRTIFVVRAGLLDRRSLPLIDELYESNKYKHMSLLLNGVDVQSKQYGYGRYGGYGYGYGYEHE